LPRTPGAARLGSRAALLRCTGTTRFGAATSGGLRASTAALAPSTSRREEIGGAAASTGNQRQRNEQVRGGAHFKPPERGFRRIFRVFDHASTYHVRVFEPSRPERSGASKPCPYCSDQQATS